LIRLIGLVACCAALTGCGGRQPHQVVRCAGRATFQGRPITDMSVTMNQGARGRPSRAELGADGRFSMQYTFRQAGVQAGQNEVHFLWNDMAEPPDHVRAVLDHMKRHGPLTVTIDRPVNDLEIAIP
jgi:hypothetical protein